MGQEIERRPLVLILIGLVIGLTAAEHPLNLIFLAAGLVWLRSVRVWALLACGFGVGLVLAPPSFQPVLEPTYEEGELFVTSVPRESQDRSIADASICGLRVLLNCPASLDIHRGDRLAVSGAVQPAIEIVAPALYSEGIQGTLRIEEAKKVGSGPIAFAWADGWRRSFEAFTASVGSSAGSGEDAAWLDRLCFRSGSLAPRDREEMEEAGTSYLVAASGLQVLVLSGMIVAAAGLCRFDRRVGVVAACIVLAGYCLATGLHLSTLRASLACALFLSAYLWRREPDALSSLALAGVGFLLIDPFGVYGLGFAVTTVVITGLALFMPRITPGDGLVERIGGWVKQGLMAGFIVVLAGEPLFAFYSGRFSVGTVPATLLTGVVAPFAVGLSFLAFVLAEIWRPIGALLLGAAVPLVGYLRLVTHTLAMSRLGIDVPGMSAWWLVLYYGLWLAAWRPRVRRS